MGPQTDNLCCPHCGKQLQAFAVPEGLSGWEPGCHHFACFNDACTYFREGWAWMLEKFGKKASYRYRVTDPAKGQATPLAVWSKTAFRDHIVEEGD